MNLNFPRSIEIVFDDGTTRLFDAADITDSGCALEGKLNSKNDFLEVGNDWECFINKAHIKIIRYFGKE